MKQHKLCNNTWKVEIIYSKHWSAGTLLALHQPRKYKNPEIQSPYVYQILKFPIRMNTMDSSSNNFIWTSYLTLIIITSIWIWECVASITTPARNTHIYYVDRLNHCDVKCGMELLWNTTEAQMKRHTFHVPNLMLMSKILPKLICIWYVSHSVRFG